MKLSTIVNYLKLA